MYGPRSASATLVPPSANPGNCQLGFGGVIYQLFEPAQTAMIGCMPTSSHQLRYSISPTPLYMLLAETSADDFYILSVDVAPISHTTYFAS